MGRNDGVSGNCLFQLVGASGATLDNRIRINDAVQARGSQGGQVSSDSRL